MQSESTPSRREFLRIAGAAALGVLVESCTPSSVRDTLNVQQEATLLDIVKSHDVTLRGDFTLDELKNITDVLNIYRSKIGDLRGYGFVIEKMKLDMSLYKSDGLVYGFYTPLSGYPDRGVTNINTAEISIAPREVINHYDEWMKDSTKSPNTLTGPNGVAFFNQEAWRYSFTPEGEEGRVHDFRWSLAHEIAHSLSFKLGFGYDLLGGLEAPKHELGVRWIELDRKIREECQNGSEDYKTNKRPLGFPTLVSWEGYGEAFADTSAYYLLGAGYANDDKLFMRRIEIVRLEFKSLSF